MRDGCNEQEKSVEECRVSEGDGGAESGVVAKTLRIDVRVDAAIRASAETDRRAYVRQLEILVMRALGLEWSDLDGIVPATRSDAQSSWDGVIAEFHASKRDGRSPKLTDLERKALKRIGGFARIGSAKEAHLKELRRAYTKAYVSAAAQEGLTK